MTNQTKTKNRQQISGWEDLLEISRTGSEETRLKPPQHQMCLNVLVLNDRAYEIARAAVKVQMERQYQESYDKCIRSLVAMCSPSRPRITGRRARNLLDNLGIKLPWW